MKILLLEMSPKFKRTTSKYLLSHLNIILKGEVTRMKLKLGNYQEVAKAMNDSDIVVFASPTYVDGLPSTVIRFFEHLKDIDLNKNIKIYAITNCGFYEGHQNKNSLRMIEAFCNHKELSYMGGLGVGAGEMIGVTRYFNFFLAFLILFIEILINAIVSLKSGHLSLFHPTNLIGPSISVILYFVFNLRLYYNIIKLNGYIKKQKPLENNLYTSVFCPRFLFVIFADLFWIIKALLRGVLPFKLYRKIENTNS